MIQNQLGSTLYIDYPLYIEGEETLEGKDLKLYIDCKNFHKSMPLSISGNTISFVFEGKDQVVSGVYSIEVVLNEGKADQVVLKTKDVFRLYR